MLSVGSNFWGRTAAIRASKKLSLRSRRKNCKAQPDCSAKRSHARRKIKYWEITGDRLGKSGWTWGCSFHIDSTGRVLFTSDAHRDNGKRFIVRADEKLTALGLKESQPMTAAKRLGSRLGRGRDPVNANSHQFAAGFSYYLGGEMRSGLAAV
jgi:hypothetical protein